VPCPALPTERLTHGEPGFFVRDKKLFVMLADHHRQVAPKTLAAQLDDPTG
jgi:hypothetical protein